MDCSSRSKSEVVQNRAEFCTFCPSPNLIGPNRLILGSFGFWIFNVKNCWGGSPSLVERVLASLGHSLVHVEIWGAKIWSCKKVDFSGSTCRSQTLLFCQSSLDFCSPNVTGIAVDRLVFRFWISSFFIRSWDIGDEVWSCTKLPHILHAQIFLWEGSPNFGTRIIKLNTLSITWQSFMAIGQGSWDIPAEKRKEITSAVKHKPTKALPY